MPKLSPACLPTGLVAAALGIAMLLGLGFPAHADPYQWLEGVDDPRALAWVRAENARTEAELASTPGFKRLEAEIRAILDSDAKIPVVEKIGDHYYNFWKDAQHERGLWRRTTLDEYR
jgi:prolyl oligopeptidase